MNQPPLVFCLHKSSRKTPLWFLPAPSSRRPAPGSPVLRGRSRVPSLFRNSQISILPGRMLTPCRLMKSRIAFDNGLAHAQEKQRPGAHASQRSAPMCHPPIDRNRPATKAIHGQMQVWPPAEFWLTPDIVAQESVSGATGRPTTSSGSGKGVGRKGMRVPNSGRPSNPNRETPKSRKKKVSGGGRGIRIHHFLFGSSGQGEHCSKPLRTQSQTIAENASQTGELFTLDGKLLCECGEHVGARTKPWMDGLKGGGLWPTPHYPKKLVRRLANPSLKPGYYKKAPR